MDNTINYIKSLNINDDYVVLACSYGPDSMCLLDILVKNNINVVVAHVNHKIRKESEQEYLDLEAYCKNKNIKFEGFIINEYPKGNFEANARTIRYEFFESIIKKYHAKYLFTAHHGDDLMETILMRINRGSSHKGYAGFNIKTDKNKYSIVRPLIYMTKDEILKYDENNNITYAIDKTNLELIQTRNKYRHKVLPVLKEINPNIHEKFIKFSNTINEYNEYIESVVDDSYSKLYLNNRLDLNESNFLPLLIKKCLLNKILLNIYKEDINLINDTHLTLIMDLIDSDKVNTYICLPNKIKVYKYYNILEFTTKEDTETYDYIFDGELEKNDWSLIIIDETNIVKSNYLLRLNSKDIKLPLHIRTRKEGDKISLKNSGTKKIKDIFIDSKVPIDERNIYPIITDENDNILWVPGIKKCKLDKQTNEEYDIIIKYIKKEKSYEK